MKKDALLKKLLVPVKEEVVTVDGTQFLLKDLTWQQAQLLRADLPIYGRLTFLKHQVFDVETKSNYFDDADMEQLNARASINNPTLVKLLHEISKFNDGVDLHPEEGESLGE